MAEAIRVVCVDPQRGLAEEIASCLTSADKRFVADTTTSLDETVTRLGDESVDCLVVVHRPRGRTGIDLVTSIRQLSPDLPVIFVPADGSEAVASRAISAGVTDYLRKDAVLDDAEVLASTIREHVRERRRSRGQQHLVAAVETAQKGLSILDDDGYLLYVNEAYASLYGYDRETLIGNHWDRLSPDDTVGRLTDEGLPAVAETGTWEGDVTGLRADGVTVATKHVLSKTESGGYICSIPDTSPTTEHQTAMTVARRAMDAAPLGITITDPSREDNPIVYANDRFQQLTGYTEDEILGRNCRILQGEGTDPDAVATMREAIDADEPVSVELRNYRKDGTEFWNEVTIAPVRDESGAVTHYVGFNRDVTERKEYEQQLELFQQTVEQAGHGVVITNREGTIEYVNPTYAADTGYSPVEAVGLNPRIVKSGKHDEAFYEELWDTILAGEVWEAELVNRRKSGQLYHVEQTIAPITNQNGTITHFVGIELDITDRRVRQQRLSVLNRIMRHNVRNWMTTIRGSATLLSERLEDDTLCERADVIEERANDMIEMGEKAATVESLLDNDPVAEPVSDVGSLLGDVVAEVEAEYPETEITLRESRNTLVQTDERIQFAFKEVIENAIVHCDQPHPDVTVTLEPPQSTNLDNFIDVSVADTGPGIPKHEQQAINLDEEQPLLHGTGLGLWLSHWITAHFGGELEIEENEPCGSVVTLRLPVANPEQGPDS